MFRLRNYCFGPLFALRLLVIISCGACSGKSKDGTPREQTPPHTPAEKQAIEKADRLIERGYDLKKTGHNRAALNLFEQANTILSQSIGQNSEEYASILDDEATVLLRTGDYQKARAFYEKAAGIVAELGGEKSRLADGIKRRLATLEALEKSGILCNEPLAPPESRDAGETGSSSPYFPKLEDVHNVFSKINQHLGGCGKRPIGSIPIRVVLTGDGRIIVAETRGNLGDTPPGDCLEKKIRESAPRYAESFPKFQACFRNFTFPFVPD